MKLGPIYTTRYKVYNYITSFSAGLITGLVLANFFDEVIHQNPFLLFAIPVPIAVAVGILSQILFANLERIKMRRLERGQS